MSNFYGKNINNLSSNNFVFDVVYESYKELNNSAATDGVFVNRYALVQYGQQLGDDTYEENAKKDEYNYNNTVWQKMSDGQYRLIANLDPRTPTMTINYVNPGEEIEKPVVSDLTNHEYRVTYYKPWEFEAGTVTINTEEINDEDKIELVTKDDKKTKTININLPTVAKAINTVNEQVENVQTLVTNANENIQEYINAAEDYKKSMEDLASNQITGAPGLAYYSQGDLTPKAVNLKAGQNIQEISLNNNTKTYTISHELIESTIDVNTDAITLTNNSFLIPTYTITLSNGHVTGFNETLNTVSLSSITDLLGKPSDTSDKSTAFGKIANNTTSISTIDTKIGTSSVTTTLTTVYSRIDNVDEKIKTITTNISNLESWVGDNSATSTTSKSLVTQIEDINTKIGTSKNDTTPTTVYERIEGVESIANNNTTSISNLATWVGEESVTTSVSTSLHKRVNELENTVWFKSSIEMTKVEDGESIYKKINNLTLQDDFPVVWRYNEENEKIDDNTYAEVVLSYDQLSSDNYCPIVYTFGQQQDDGGTQTISSGLYMFTTNDVEDFTVPTVRFEKIKASSVQED